MFDARPLLTVMLVLCAMPAAADAIRSRADLETHLREHATDSPVNLLSAGARERFLYSLRFGEQGLSSASGVDLGDELTQPQILAVMALFGEEAVKHAPDSHSEELGWLEKRTHRRDQIGPIERRYNDYFKACVDIPDLESEPRLRQRVAAFELHLAELYRGRALNRIDDHELRLLRRAAHEVASATREQVHVDAFRAVFAERQRRNLVSSDDVVTLQALLLSLHRIADARRLAGEYRGMQLPRLPQFRDPFAKDGAGKPTVWRFDGAGKQLTREAVDLSAPQILVTGRCHIARDAAADISADPLLGPAFTRHARWLTLAPGVESIDAVRNWNAAFPAAPMFMIYDPAEWRVLPAWRAPEFYVVRDGKVVDSLNGWVRGSAEYREGLVAMLRRQGLLD
jgi:hypothetical protein